MQNFTFGRKGHNWFLFAFILFVGNLSASYAQNCPTLSSTGDNFCYLDRVSDLSPYVSANGDGVRWYRTATSNTPIPNDEILQDGSYFAGNNSGNCSSREEFSVTVDDLGPPTSSFGNFYEPCEYSSSDVTTVGELKSLINPSSPTYDINVYGQNDEFGTNEITDDSTPLVEGNSYFIGQDDPLSSCRYSSRIAIRYNPILATAPSADANQTYCEGSTVADLEAQGINRWYSTATSNPFLDPSTPLQDGETYYASRIVNRTNSSLPPCESQDRTPVTVTVNRANAGENGSVTLSPSDDPVNLIDFLNGPDTGGNWSPGNGIFDPETDTPGDFTYTVDNGTCSDSAVVTVIVEGCTANAGSDNLNNTICRDQVVANPSQDEVRAYFRTLIRNASSTSGTFSDIPSITSRIRAGEAGPFNTTYTVAAGTACEDTAEFSASIVEPSEPNAGSFNNIADVCSNGETIDLTTLVNNDSNATPGGTFSGQGVTDNIFDPSIGSGNYSITYSVDDSLPCVDGEDDQVDFTISVQDSPDAGGDGSVTLSPSDDPVNLIDFLNGPDTGGNWSPGNGIFDPETDTPGDFTYTVDNGTCSDSAVVTVIVEGCTANAGSDNLNNTICRDQVVANPSQDEVRAYFRTLIRNASSTSGTFSDIPSITSRIRAGEAGPFNTTYTVAAGTACEDTAEFSASIVEPSEPNAGSFNNIADVCSNGETIDLTTLVNNDSNATPGGTFSGQGVTDNIFDPSIGSGNYSITYSVDDSLPCVDGEDDQVDFTISVQDSPDAGGDGSVTLSPLDDPVNLIDFLNGPDTGGNWSPGNGIFDPETDTPGDFTYTVDNGTCSDSAVVTVIVEGCTANAGSDNLNNTICRDQVVANPSQDEVRAYFRTLIRNASSTSGTFSDIPSITSRIRAGEAGPFNTTYTVAAGTACEDTAEFSASIVEPSEPNAGSFNNIADVCSNGETIDLTTLVNNDSNATPGGTFSGQGVTDNIFDPSIGSGNYSITYSVDDSLPCVDGEDDQVDFTISVQDSPDAGGDGSVTLSPSDDPVNLIDFLNGPDTGGNWSPGNGIFDPETDTPGDFTYTVDNGTCSDSAVVIVIVEGCTANAGSDNLNNTICRDQVVANPSQDEVRAYFRTLIRNASSTSGTFSDIPSITSRIRAGEAGPFNTTYTVAAGTACEDTAEFSASIVLFPAEIDEIEDPDPICQNAEDVNLFDFLADGANTNGRFEGYDDGIFSPSSVDPGSYTITYILDETSECTEGEASEDFTITVTESAFAGQDKTIPETCKNSAEIDLAVYISDADQGGVFTLQSTGEVIEGGLLNPSDLVSGNYVIVYTVSAVNDCGEDSSDLSLTISETPDAPTVDGDPFTFCATDDATGADLSATGSNLTFYSDAELTMMVMADDELVSGTYYVTQREDENGCESDATAFSVSINDADTPTISNTTQEFCDFDDPTIADLTAQINETGTITWYDSNDGENSLSEGTALQDGVTYYATLTNATTGCESSTRLGVEVNIGGEECELFIPEGFSPNGDTFNDTFAIRNIRNLYPNFTIEIRNRFGDVVYKGNANTPDWDGFSSEGSFGNNILPVGAYFYYIDFRDNLTEPRRGTVYLSR